MNTFNFKMNEYIYENEKCTFYTNTTLGEVKIGDVIMINNNPAKIVEYTTAKPGKHGCLKVMLIAIDIFTKKKYQLSQTSTTSIEKVFTEKHNYFLMFITDNAFHGMAFSFRSLR